MRLVTLVLVFAGTIVYAQTPAAVDLTGAYSGRLDLSKPDGVKTVIVQLSLTHRTNTVVGSWTAPKEERPWHGTIEGTVKVDKKRGAVFNGRVVVITVGTDNKTRCRVVGQFAGPIDGEPVTWESPRGFTVPDRGCANPYGAAVLRFVRDGQESHQAISPRF